MFTAADTGKAADSAAISAAGINSQIDKLKIDLDGLKTLKNSVLAEDNLGLLHILGIHLEKQVALLNAVALGNIQHIHASRHQAAYCADVFARAKTEELEKAKALLKAGGISQSDYDNAKQGLKNVKLEKEKYSREFRLNIESVSGTTVATV